jgi:hydrogenase maturation protease
MSYAGSPSSDFWIIGYGNSQRRDDGIGPYIVKRLQPLFEHRSNIHLLVLHQLEPNVIDALKNAHTILFVDATVEALVKGRHWAEIQPELMVMPCLIHQATPSFILGLLQCLYHQRPKTWLVSIEGNDFRFGSGLSPGVQKRVEKVICEITEFVLTEVPEKDKITSIESKLN